MDGNEGIRISAILHDKSMPREDSERVSRDNNCDTGMPNPTVLSNSAEHVNPSACVTASNEVSPNRARREPSPTDRNGNVEMSDVEISGAVAKQGEI